MPPKRGWDQFYAEPADWGDDLGEGNSGADTHYIGHFSSPKRAASPSRSPSPSPRVPGAWATHLTFPPAMRDGTVVSTRPARSFTTSVLRFAAKIPEAIRHVGDSVNRILTAQEPGAQEAEAHTYLQRIRPEPVFPHQHASKRILLDDGLVCPGTPSNLARQIPGAWSPLSTARHSTPETSSHDAAQAKGDEAAPATPTTPLRSPSPFELPEAASLAASSPFFDGTQTHGTPGLGSTSHNDNVVTPNKGIVGMKSRAKAHFNGKSTINNASRPSGLSSTPSTPCINRELASTVAYKHRRTHSTPNARRILTTASPSRVNISPASKEKRRAAHIKKQLHNVAQGRVGKREQILTQTKKLNILLRSTKDEDEKASIKAQLEAVIRSENENKLQSRLDAQEQEAAVEMTVWDAEFVRANDGQSTPASTDTIPDGDGIRVLPPPTNDVWGESPQKPIGAQKSVGFNKQVRLRPYFQDDAVDDVIESFITDLNETPVKIPDHVHIVPPKAEPTELSVSREVVDEVRLAPPNKTIQKEVAEIQEAKQETPAIIVEDRPLLPPVGPKDLKLIIEASEKTNGGRIQKDLVEGKLSTHDMKTVLPQDFNGPQLGWLNDNVINGYLEVLTDHEKKKAGYQHRRGGPAPPVHALTSQWYTNARRDIKSIARWATRKQCGGKNLLDVKLMLLPVCENDHWRLVAIKPQERTIEYLDSLGWDGTHIIRTTAAWVKQELGDLWVENEWTIARHQRSRRQLNGSDCGVFTCLNSLALLKDADPGSAQVDSGMREGRQHIAVSLLSGKLHGGC